MAGNRDYLVGSTATDFQGTDIVCGSAALRFVSLRGVRTHNVLGDSRPQAGGLQGDDGVWHVINCQPKGRTSRVRMFLCHGEADRVGIRTSQDWNHTYWGVKCPVLPDVWVVVMSMPPCKMEYKLVSGSDDNLCWEPDPFKNRSIELAEQCQVVEATWGKLCPDQIVNVGPRKRALDVTVTVPDDIEQVLNENPEHKLVMKNMKNENNKMMFEKGVQIPLFWTECYSAHHAVVSVTGHLKAFRFSLAVVDEYNMVTHIDKYCFSEPRYREIHFPYAVDTIRCEAFVDVRPLKWRTAMASSPLPAEGTPARSLYDLVHRSPAVLSHNRTPNYKNHAIMSGDLQKSTSIDLSKCRDMILAMSGAGSGSNNNKSYTMTSNVSLYRDIILGHVPLHNNQPPAPNQTPRGSLSRLFSRSKDWFRRSSSRQMARNSKDEPNDSGLSGIFSAIRSYFI